MVGIKPELPRYMEPASTTRSAPAPSILHQNGADTLFRIHGTNEPWSIGEQVSSGCVRMLNAGRGRPLRARPRRHDGACRGATGATGFKTALGPFFFFFFFFFLIKNSTKGLFGRGLSRPRCHSRRLSRGRLGEPAIPIPRGAALFPIGITARHGRMDMRRSEQFFFQAPLQPARNDSAGFVEDPGLDSTGPRPFSESSGTVAVQLAFGLHYVSSQHLRCSRAYSEPRDRAMAQWVYTFGDGKAEGQAGMKNLLGGKGANLAEMANLGLPVPPGFTITTEVCTYYYDQRPRAIPKELSAQVEQALAHVGKLTGSTFGDADNPLLVSVRSGARASMPGMMDTVLNLGLNDDTVEALAEAAGDERFAYDSYRRFITMYSNVVLGIEHHHFEEIARRLQGPQGLHARHRPRRPTTGGSWSARYKERRRGGAGASLPAGSARAAVGRDRRRVRLLDERARHHLSRAARHSGKLGHRGQRAGHGVRQHGRDLGDRRRLHAQPLDRREALYGEFLINAQGEDVVAGIRTPQDITEAARIGAGSDKPSMEGAMPEAFKRADAHLRHAREALPRHAGHGVHGRAGQALDAADPQRQAHRQGGARASRSNSPTKA